MQFISRLSRVFLTISLIGAGLCYFVCTGCSVDTTGQVALEKPMFRLDRNADEAQQKASKNQTNTGSETSSQKETSSPNATSQNNSATASAKGTAGSSAASTTGNTAGSAAANGASDDKQAEGADLLEGLFIVRPLILHGSVEDRLEALDSYLPLPKELENLPDNKNLFSFSLNPKDKAPALDEEAVASLRELTDSLDDRGIDQGYLLMDLGSGRGLASNIDELFYSASTLKAPFALFVYEEILEPGKASPSTQLSQSYASSYLERQPSNMSLGNLLKISLEASDNDAYRILRANYEGFGFSDWADDLGVDGDRLSATWYSYLSVRDLSALWLELYDYLEEESRYSDTLAQSLSDTEVSFIRTGLSEAYPELDITTLNKAGWISTASYESLGDAAIVSLNGHDYLMVILTNSSESEDADNAVTQLAAALFEARNSLA